MPPTPRRPRSWPSRRATGGSPRRFAPVGSLPVLLVRAAHPRQALLTAVGLALGAALSGRSGREVGLVLVTVLVGQAILGWHNDLVDRRHDEAAARADKPVATGALDPGTAWFTLLCAVLLVVPLAVASGVIAGCAYLLSVAIGMTGNVVLRRGLFAWVPWAAAYALYSAYLSYGGWGGATRGDPPEIAMVVLAALLGVGAHVLSALPGLVPDHERGDRHLALRLALRTGAGRLRLVALAWMVLVLAGMVVVGNAVGLRQ